MNENKHEINLQDSSSDGMNEIVLYQPDSTLSLEVKVENETVWLSQSQMAELFQATKQNISLHISNIYKERELDSSSTVKEYLTVQTEGNRRVKRSIAYYNLDVIISVGYRVKSIRGTKFRQWASGIIKDYLLRGYSVNQRLLDLENRMDKRFLEHDKRLDGLSDKVDFFVRTSLPPQEGVFFDGQIFDAHKFIVDLISSAKKRVILIDNYINASVLTQLDNRKPGVTAIVYTRQISQTLSLDIERHNDQYTPIDVRTAYNIHDRFLVIDDTLYHIGASIKDLGSKLFAFSKLDISPSLILDNI